MKTQRKDVLYFETGRDNEPTLHVDPGEEFIVETQMNAGPWLDTHPQGEELRRKLISGNPSSGCIYVDGAKPGDMLTVHVGEIELAEVGYTRFSGSTGAMPGWLGASGIGHVEKLVDIKDGKIIWSDELQLPVAPMVGFVGVAPARERWRNNWGGEWGGNFDVPEITKGAAVHLPIDVPGALLHVGDMHAIQGDGEVCGAGGIETEGTVRLSCELSPKPKSMTWPRITNDTHIMAVGMARPAEDAFRIALEQMILWLEDEYGMDRGEAYMLLGQVLEARVTQFVNPTFTYIAKVAKKYLPSPTP
ncbi:MAG: acetamidase [Planctomycetes bacterium]|nr:acetamidase [Planctomycetota bacterium]